MVVAVDDVEASIRIVGTVRKHFPQLQIVARARNRIHAHQLRELGVRLITRETFGSALEMAGHTLTTMGATRESAADTVARFRHHDEAVLERQFAVQRDEEQLIQTAKEAAEELSTLFDSDAADSHRGEDPLDLARSWK